MILSDEAIPGQYCEVCNKPAIVIVYDFQEIEPIRNAQGQLWARWQYDGGPHQFCFEHARQSRKLDMQGHPVPTTWGETVCEYIAFVTSGAHMRVKPG